MKITKISFILLISSMISMGCVYNHPEPKEAKEELRNAMTQDLEIPEDVLNELTPDNPLEANVLNEKVSRITVSANKVPAVEFFGQIMAQTHTSVVVHPEVSGEITLNLENVTTHEIFDALYNMYGYRAEKQGSLFYIYPAGVHTETIPMNYIFLKRASETSINITNNTVTNSDSSSDSDSSSSSDSDSSSDSESSSGTTVTTTSESDFWTELENTLKAIVGEGEGRVVTVNPQAANITVRGTPEEISAVRHFIEMTEKSLRRQVVIEAKLLEVTLNENYAQGIEWSRIFNGSSDESKTLGTNSSWLGGVTDNVYSILGGGINLSLEDKKYSALITLLKTQGDVTTLSSPRITALNNQKAIMKIGKDAYFLTDISTDSSATSSSETSLVSSNYDFEPFFSGVSLDVVPQISEDGNILMHIHPAVIEVSEDKKVLHLQGEDTELPFASSEIRETDTLVEAKSGDVIVIGGLMRHQKGDLQSKVPVIGDIPILGELFTNKVRYDQKSELVILLKPVIVGGDTWREELNKSLQLLEKWYPEDSSSSPSFFVDDWKEDKTQDDDFE